MAKSAVTTWADSFGMWHAEVYLFSNTVSKSAARSRARRAILAEINARESATLNHMPLKVDRVTCDPDSDIVYSITYREAF